MRYTDIAAVLDPLEVLVDVVEELRDDHVRPRVHLRDNPSVTVYIGACVREYKGTSLITKRILLGPYSRTIPRVIWWS